MEHTETPRRWTIALLAFAGFVSMASVRVCDGLLPELIREFGHPATQTAHVVTTFAIGYGIMQLFFGPMGDRFGKYRVIAVATLACAGWSLASVFAPNLEWLIVLRGITGGTTAALIPLSLAWIGDTVPYEQRQPVIARMIIGVILGVGGGQVLGGGLADTLGWRWAFGTLGILYLVVGILLQVELRRNAASHARLSPGTGRFSVIPRVTAVLRTPWARRVIATVFMEGMLVFGPLAFIPYYLNRDFGISLALAGAVVALFAVGGFVYTTLAKRLVATLGEAGLCVGGGTIAMVAMVGVAMGPAWYWTVPASFLLGLGYYMLHNTLQTNATQMTPEHRGTAVSLFAAAFFLGQSAGVTLAAVVIHRAGPVWLFSLAAAGMLLLGGGFAAGLRRQGR